MFGRQAVGTQALQQVGRHLAQHLQVAAVFGGRGREVLIVEVKTGAQGVFAKPGRRDVALGTDHRGQRFTRAGLRQPSDLPTDALERYVCTEGETLDLRSPCEHHDTGAGQHAVTGAGLPLVVEPVQFQCLVVGEHFNQWMFGLPLAQRGRMHPTALWKKQPAVGQFDSRLLLRLLAVQQMQQVRSKGVCQLSLTLDLFGVKRQLQHATAVPIDTSVQVFQQASGVAKTADYQLGQGRAMGRKLEVQHTLWVARRFLCQAGVALQKADTPTPGGQAGGGRAPGQATADDQGMAFSLDGGWPGEPGFTWGRRG